MHFTTNGLRVAGRACLRADELSLTSMRDGGAIWDDGARVPLAGNAGLHGACPIVNHNSAPASPKLTVPTTGTSTAREVAHVRRLHGASASSES